MRFWEPERDCGRILCRTLLIMRRHEARHALPDSSRSLLEPPLLVRLRIPSLLLPTLPVSVSVSIWSVHSVRSLLEGAIPRVLVWTPWVLLVGCNKSAVHECGYDECFDGLMSEACRAFISSA